MSSITSITTDRRCTMRVGSGSSALPIIAQQTPARIVPAMKRPSQSFDSEAGGVVLMNAL